MTHLLPEIVVGADAGGLKSDLLAAQLLVGALHDELFIRARFRPSVA